MTQPSSRAGTFGAILRVTSGNFLEQFDFFLFGFYATYIARTFFPAESEFAALMLTFAVFGSGFLMQLFIILSLLMNSKISTYALQSFCANIIFTFKLRTCRSDHT